MESGKNVDVLYDKKVRFPDADYLDRFDALVGLDEEKQRIQKFLRFMLFPGELKEWAKRYKYSKSETVIDTVLSRPPLIIFSGDVGTGKTEFASTIGASVSKVTKKTIHLYSMSLSSRGEGRVGEMTRLISDAFRIVYDDSVKYGSSSGVNAGGNVLLIDEADALAQSREQAQMHHEDRAGVNALIRGIDSLSSPQCPAAVIMCTNRLKSMDPAVQRRAAEIIEFSRPNFEQRRLMFNSLSCFGFTKNQIDKLAQVGENQDVGFTYSDIRQRFIPSIVLDAAPNNKIEFTRVVRTLKSLRPTPPFSEE